MKEKLIAIGKVICFLLIGAVLFRMYCYMIRPLDSEHIRNRITGFYALEDQSVDMVGIGSSAIYRFINSAYVYDHYGYTYYSFCIPTMGCEFYKYAIEEVRKTQSPDLYVIEARRFLKLGEKNTLNEKRLMQLSGNMKYSQNRWQMISSVVNRLEDPSSYYLDVMSYHSDWPNFKPENFKYYNNSVKSEDAGWTNISRIKELKKHKIEDVTETAELSAAAEDILRDLCEYCKEEQLHVIFVDMPFEMTKKYKKKSNRFAEIIKEYGLSFYELNDETKEMGIDYKTDFYDKSHVNCVGARKTTGYFMEYLMEHEQIPQKERTDAVTSYWERVSEMEKEDFKIQYQKLKEKVESSGHYLPSLEELL